MRESGQLAACAGCLKRPASSYTPVQSPSRELAALSSSPLQKNQTMNPPEQGITIIHHRQEDPFARVPKSLLDDPNLSWKAKGILAYLLGKPQGWKTQISDIVKRGKDGSTSVTSGLRELRAAHYARLECNRDPKGSITGWTLLVSDSPNLEPDTGATSGQARNRETGTKAVVPHSNPPESGFQEVGSTEVGTQGISKKECSKKESTKKEGACEKPSARKDPVVVLPLLLNTPEFIQAWTEWLADRKARGKTVTLRAAKIQLGKMELWGPAKAVEAINNSIANGWTGIFEPREVRQYQQAPPARPTHWSDAYSERLN